ncbi:hypothetical protein OAJ90_06605 [Nitrosopumilus sp.]|uniref:Uncharacterized protein n=1 Tax=uncultured marine thaumarchaeote KM3_12_F11 TaxID=1455999 RepID=A0A075GA57_9ARCH|nr:hypothetical protein [uncultured marine thaumarchaeote KM3_12_F11]MDC0209286.1 hypothetical protein [Nitrosopumilus sp.]RCL30431.1 MAG: hypothetical protein DBX08_06680 [Nitrosopumilus sp.]|tara:strand:- start:471 stop:1004 length:534 start_codon:yes stop_codon:yes gene_type:complete
MVKPVYFVLGAIPVIVAILLALPLVTKNEIPVSASNSFDKLEIEYTKHQLKKISNGIAERTGSEKTEIILIKNDGEIKYTITEKGYPQPDIKSKIDEQQLNKIKALIKETGFISIDPNSFSVFQNVTDFQKSSVKVTLNGRVNQVHWPESSATPDFIPPIITMVESELDKVMSEFSE